MWLVQAAQISVECWTYCVECGCGCTVVAFALVFTLCWPLVVTKGYTRTSPWNMHLHQHTCHDDTTKGTSSHWHQVLASGGSPLWVPLSAIERPFLSSSSSSFFFFFKENRKKNDIGQDRNKYAFADDDNGNDNDNDNDNDIDDYNDPYRPLFYLFMTTMVLFSVPRHLCPSWSWYVPGGCFVWGWRCVVHTSSRAKN